MHFKFIQCGLIGWCLEVFWTGLNSFRKREKKLMGQSSLWMFPIYGCAALIHPISRLLKEKSPFFRGTFYMLFIFLAEFLSGKWLKKRGCCPWDYSKARLNVDGVIRLDYAPVWFVTGLLYEKLLR